MFGKLINGKIQGEVDEDVYVATLESERDWIYLRQNTLSDQMLNHTSKLSSDAGRELLALEARLEFILSKICMPDVETLWTSDEVSAWVNEEELAKARERLDSAIAKAREYGDYLRDNPGSPYLETQRNRWLEIIRKRNEEVLRLENILIDNPKSGWLPF